MTLREDVMVEEAILRLVLDGEEFASEEFDLETLKLLREIEREDLYEELLN